MEGFKVGTLVSARRHRACCRNYIRIDSPSCQLKTQLLEFVVAVSAGKLRQRKSHVLRRLRSVRSGSYARRKIQGWLHTVTASFDHHATNSINQSTLTSNPERPVCAVISP